MRARSAHSSHVCAAAATFLSPFTEQHLDCQLQPRPPAFPRALSALRACWSTLIGFIVHRRRSCAQEEAKSPLDRSFQCACARMSPLCSALQPLHEPRACPCCRACRGCGLHRSIAGYVIATSFARVRARCATTPRSAARARASRPVSILRPAWHARAGRNRVRCWAASGALVAATPRAADRVNSGRARLPCGKNGRWPCSKRVVSVAEAFAGGNTLFFRTHVVLLELAAQRRADESAVAPRYSVGQPCAPQRSALSAGSQPHSPLAPARRLALSQPAH